MKLFDLKPILTESVIPIEVYMILKEVIQAGKITNAAQAVLMANICQFLKYETPNNIRLKNEHPASADMYNDIKTLEPGKQVDLASLLYSQLSAGELPTCYRDASMSTLEWIQWVLRKQD